MKKPLFIISTIILLHIFGCRSTSLGVCGFGYEYRAQKGPGEESKLLLCESVNNKDTTLAFVNVETTYLENEKEVKAIGTTILINKIDEVDPYKGGCTDIDGKYFGSYEPAKYDLTISYTGFNSLLLKNCFFERGTTINLKIQLGRKGQDIKDMEINLDKKI